MRLLFFLCFFIVCLTAQENSLEELFLSGVNYQNEQKWANAVRVFKEVVRQRPQQFRVYNRIGFCFEQLGYADIAEDYYHKTLSYDPQNEFARSRLKTFVHNKLLKNTSILEEEAELLQKKEEQKADFARTLSNMQRLWFTRQGLLYTIMRDGRDLSLFSRGIVGQIFPDSAESGFPAVVPPLLNEETDEPVLEKQSDYLHFFDFRKNNFIKLTALDTDNPEPFYHEKSQTVFFLGATEGARRGLFRIGVEENMSAERLLADFHHVEHMVYDKKTDRLYLSGLEQEGHSNNKSFRWDFNLKSVPERLTYGPGDEDQLRISPNGRFMLCRRRNQDGYYNFVVVDLTNRSAFQISFFNSDLLEGVWSYDSSRVFFASSVRDEKDKLQTVAGWINIETKFIMNVFNSNFQIRNLIMDETDDYVYYLTDYDNNLEIYRWDFKHSLPERLTISDEDEIQLGFWGFSVY